MTPPGSFDAERRALVQKLLEQRGIRRTGATSIPRRADGPIPLSFPQQRLWFLHQLDPRTSAYNLTAALALSGDLDVGALRRALAGVVSRHDALRMGFATVNGEAVVELRDHIAVDLPLVDLTREREPFPSTRLGAGRRAEIDAVLQQRLLAHAHEPFDLARPPLFRAQLLRLGAREHVLVLTAHHIVFDGWSIALLIRELAALYRAALSPAFAPARVAPAPGAAAPVVSGFSRTGVGLPALPIGCADFSAWQRARHASGAFDADLSYWTTQLADLPLLDLPTDRPRPAVSTFAGGSRTFTLGPDLIARLGAVGRDGNATLFMTLAAAFSVLLGRYSNQTDVAVGSPIAGRSAPEIEGLIGLFANTLVLRADLSGRPTFRELLERVRRMTLDAYAHQDAPFEYLVERMRPERRLSEQPLFQVALAMQHEGVGALTLPGLDVRVLDVPSDSSKFDLTVALTEERGGISGSAEFSTDLFDASTIERMLDSFRTLLDAAAASPDTPIDRLPLLSPEQHRAVADIWPDVEPSPAVTERLHESFERQARTRPDAVAVSCGDEALTYAVLNARANQLAHYLRRHGIGRDHRVEDLVGLYLDRGADTVVAILAVLKAGGAYVPIDPVNPSERVSLILEDAGVRLLLSERALSNRLPDLPMPVLLLDEIADAVDHEPATELRVEGPPTSLAYVIYTSGSTGRPKGVLIQHDHVQRLFSSTDRWFGFGDRDVWTLFHSYGFDFSVWELWGALLYGGRLVVVPHLISRSPEAFRDLIAAEGVTVLNQTPSAFAQLIDADARAHTPLALRMVIFGGEALDLETLRPWFDRHGDVTPQLVNMYGITETTVHVTYRPIGMADLDARAGSVIGRPIPDLRLLVLDRHLEPVPFGVAGELFVGGAGVGRGYLDRADLTAEKFVPDPLAAGGRLYRSGDLARLSPSGDLTYLGRIDHQVKIRGFRIEIGEIESALIAHADVGDAIVLALERDAADGGDRRLVAYVTPRQAGERPLTTAALREHLQSRLPDYMIPSAFVVLDRLPLTPHGKVDRRALPSPAVERADLASTYESPMTGAERVLAGVWTEVLHVDRVGRHDNFFELGGDSIRSIRVLALARERGVDATLQQLFQHQTIAGIAAAIGDAQPIAREDGPEPFALVNAADRADIAARFGDAIADAYPLSRLQEGMLFHGAYSEQSTTYHNVSSFHLRVPFDEAALTSAAARLVDRHPILRTSLHPAGFSRPLQVVHRTMAAPLAIDDWRAMADAPRQRELDAWFDADRARHFEWAIAPLFRLHIHRLRDDEMQVTLTEHHAIVDGWSVAAMLSELMTDYLGAIGLAPAASITPPAARFAEHVKRELDAVSAGDAQAFWGARLADAAAPPLPVLASPRAAGVIVHETVVPADVSSALEQLARAANVPFRTTLLAAHARLMGLLHGQRDLVTGLVVNTRPEDVDGERALGLFLNTVPLRVQLSGGTWRQLCVAIFAEERALLPHRSYPLAELQRSRGGAPLFRTAFNYVHFHVYDAVANVQGLELLGLRGAAETDLPLAASFSRDATSGLVRLSLECADTGIDAAALARIAGYYERALAAMAHDPHARYDAFSPLSAGEQQQIRAASRGARTAAGALAPARVSTHARTRPSATAIVVGDRRMTCAELEWRATRRARQLRAAGVNEESRVALISRATPDLIVAMLAVWKAGGAFVPIDPADPEERIRFMLADAAPSVVLSEEALRENSGAEGMEIDGTALGDPDPDAPAYVIYTSGSTGTPKGVMATHRGLANLLDGQIPRFGLTADSRVLQFAALGFDASISEIFTTLAAGGALVLAPRADLRVPDRLVTILRDHAVTSVTLPPTMLAVMPDHDLQALTTIVSAGEACRADLVRRWAPGRRFLNAYGPTETTVCATMSAPLDARDVATTAPIGRPLENLDTWVLDRSLAMVPIGLVGELFVGGASLARGYLGRPDLTAERFVPHPFADAPGARLYRTGDLARWRDDGRLEFVGRADSQVKIRGVRVELGEIEAILLRHPDVRHAVVVVPDEGDGAARLIAYVEHGDRVPAVEALRQHLAAALSDHVIPSSIVILDRLPLTPSGKLDRRALPAPARPELEIAYEAPRGLIQEILADIWAGVLKLDRVGVHDNFFTLGGDSILSLQIVARARARGIRVTPQQLFEHATVAALAGVAAAVTNTAAAAGRGGETTLSPIQRWFVELDVPSPHHWNQALLLEVAADIDRDALSRACRVVFGHHDAFHQRFIREGARWRQTTATDATPIELERVDLSATADEERAARIRAHSDRAQQTLDLARGPLARVVHYDCGGHSTGRILLIAHHLIVDGVSWRILLDDLQSAYEQARDGRSPELPAATDAFGAWTGQLASAASLERMHASAPFWRAQAAGADPSGPAGATADPLNTEGDASSIESWLDEDTTRDLLRTKIRAQDVMLTAAAQAIAAASGSSSVTLAIESHGRDASAGTVDLARTIGWFTAMYPVTLRVAPTDAPADTLARITEQLRAVPDAGVSYGWLRYLSPDATLREALTMTPAVSFNYLGRLDAALEAASPFRPAREPLGPMRDPSAIRPHTLDIVASVEGGRLRIAWLYPGRLQARETIDALATETMTRLRSLIAHSAGVAGDGENVDDSYALTPMQHGMLFHALYAPESGVYVQQVAARLHGSLDTALFKKAWETLVDRHAVLRTAFDWERRAEPFQAVHRHVALPWTEDDWSGDEQTARDQRLTRLLAADRARGFDLRRPPLMRVFLARLGADRWQLVWTHHHLILDGWSVPLLLADLFAAYRALRDGREPVLEPRRPFRDHVAWVRAQDPDAARAYWTGALSGLERPRLLTAGSASLSPRRGSGQAGERASDAALAGSLRHVAHRLTAASTERLTRFARSQELTLSTVVQGAWAMVLAAYSNAPEVLYGVTVGGRSAAMSGADRMVGLFINTLPVRVAPRPEARLAPWLRALQQTLARQRDFEQTPLVDVLGCSPLGRQPGAIESLFVFENYPIDAAVEHSVPGLTIEQADAHEQTDFALTVVAVPGRELLLKIDADAGRFAHGHVERLLASFGNLLERFPAAGDQLLGALPLDAAPGAAIDTSRTWPDERLVHELIDAQAERNPDAIAIRDGARVMTFGELRDASNDVAAMLAARGVSEDARVGVALPRSVELIVSLVGVLKAGGSYVPIDPEQPAARQRALVADAGIRVLIGGDDRWPSNQPRVQARVSPDALAYVLYTSGSTGTPKGVMVTHRGLANYVRWAADAYAADAGNGTLLHSPIGFDLTVTSLFPPLASGRTVHLVPQADGLDGLAAALSGRPDYSLVKITPAHLDALRDLAPEMRGATRAFVIGGDALTHDQLAHWRRTAPGTRLINEYGPTETVVGCAIYDATDDLDERGAVPIGRPIANTRLYVLDRALNTSPGGVIGDLYIAGDGVARGYHGRPELTAAAFLPDPFAADPGARMYRSGDLARVRADGVLEFFGRADDQVKIRGYRIEPGEVEAALLSEPSVREAAVVAHNGGPGERQLVAFVVTADDGRDLRACLRERLPEHLVPAIVTRVDRLPLTANGKVDRALLARTPIAEVSRERAGDPPRGVTEELVAAIWADVLGVEAIGRHDNFFDLGGHSLIATRIVSRARQAFGERIALRDVFEAPTIAALAARLRQSISADTGLADSIDPRPAGDAPVLSFAQQRLWVLDQLDPSSAAYLVPAALRIDGPLRVDAFRAALAAIVSRHESLRTRVDSVDGAPVAAIVDDCETPFTLVDLGDRDPAAQDAAIARLADADAVTPFDLARPPLLRATLLRLDASRHVLLLTMHHLISDAWSTDLLVQEIATTYAAVGDSGTALLSPLRVHYADVARWQRARLAGPALDRLVDVMRTKLAGVPALDLPTDHPRPQTPSSRGSSITVPLSSTGAAALVTLARTENATAFMAFLAAFEVLLARYTGQRDFAIGTPVSGRDRPETERLIGLFMNTLVLRSDVGERSSFVDLLRAVRATALQAQAAQDLPFERLVDALQPERALGQNPLFQVMFTLQHAPGPLTVAGLRVTPLAATATSSKFDISLSVNDTAGGWQATFEYRTDLFDEATIRRMARHYSRIVDEAARSPERDVFRLPWLDEAERTDAIETWNDTRREDDGVLVPEALERQAARTPDAIALVFEGESLTYAELSRRVTTMAEGLRAEGVGPESIVPLTLERSIELVVSLLAVLNAGAAYAPIDPSAPAERRAAMLGAIAGLRGGVRLKPDTTADFSSLAYVLFTSGSTGVPKGVAVPHRALANHMRWMQRVFPLAPDDRVLQKTPAIFDASVWEFFAPLMAGATLVVARPGAHQDPDALIAAIQRHGITTLQVVPSMLRLLVEHEGFARCASLRRVYAGGEALTRDLQDRFFAVSRAELVNLYGPTEVTIDSVVWRCRREAGDEDVPIGFPVDNTTAYVLDDRLEPVPAGVAGELYLGGASVARGYLRQPSLTAERFLPDPFSATPGAAFYRTGDRVRRRADGALEYLGRTDHQIKLRGFRIELGEIERSLESHAAVLQAVAVVRESSSRRGLVAYVVPRDGRAIDADALRAFLSTRVPDYMIPSAFVGVERLPLLPSGKIDRGALPDPPEIAAGTTGPSDAIERLLAGIWSASLGVAAVGVRDNFFALGGDSILALQVVARARKAGLTVTPAQMFVHQTIEALAAACAVDGHRLLDAFDADADDTGAIPLTPVQRWFFELPLADRDHWNQAMLLQAPADLNRAALDAAVLSLIDQHDALRLRFTHERGEWRQTYGTAGRAFEVVDLARDPSPAALDREIDRLQQSLDIGQAPLIRVAWIDYGSRPGRLLIVAHHLVIDGVSWRILLDDLQHAYDVASAGGTATDDPPAPFRTWARRLETLAASPAMAGEADYWCAQLELEPVPAPLPIDGDAGAANLEGHARHVDVELSEAQTDALLHALPAAMHTQVMDVLLAALADAVAGWTGSRVLDVELEAHGRDALDLDVSRTIGWFTALFPLRLDTRHTTAPDHLLRTVRDQMRLVPRKGAGYGLLRYASPDAATRARLAARPAPQVSFNYLGQWPGAADGGLTGFCPAPESPGRIRSASAPRTHLLEIVAGVSNRRLHIRWTYGEQLHTRQAIDALAAAYVGALDAIAGHCLAAGRGGYTPSDFTAADLDQAELDKLLSKLRGS